MDKSRSITPKRHTTPQPFAIAVCLLLLLATGYVAAYFANRDAVGCSETIGDGSVVVFYFPRYRIGGHWAATVFWPLEKLDRKLRPDAWRKKIAGRTANVP
jgi:hypothetical protein